MQIQQHQQLAKPHQQLARLRREAGLTLKEFAEPLGVSPQAVNKWERGLTPISMMAAQLIKKEYGISLFSNDVEINNSIENNSASIDGRDNTWTTQILVPLLSVRPCAGLGNSLDDYVEEVGGMPFSVHWLRRSFGVPPNLLYLMVVDGDSMIPTIAPDEMVFVVSIQHTNFRQGLWVMRLGDQLYIKRILQLGQNQFRAISDNPAYPPLELDDTAQLLGRVVGGHPRRF